MLSFILTSGNQEGTHMQTHLVGTRHSNILSKLSQRREKTEGRQGRRERERTATPLQNYVHVYCRKKKPPTAQQHA